MLRQFYTTPFVWFVPNDDNRAEDGRALREEFMDEYGIDRVDRNWYDLDCSMLEMMIALARRASFEAVGAPDEWFWLFVHNLELDRYSDMLYEIAISEEVAETLARVNERTYDRNGSGGLFPLMHAQKDQRKVELWYQLSTYLLEGRRLEIGPRA